MDLQTVLFTFFGGLGIFLYGIKSMGENRHEEINWGKPEGNEIW
ncbi:hypothetical protein [Lederbergia ruris]|uniref:Uncharacterized protein n=1 Tax=Lederbergia ruris TaxID=217495 RepID=A0ABQ4KGL5_9BACI|nr:hypothetical protein [Lederbergia ruris]GIN56259.1 hypothetical protein J8TS2_05780 [Lederbergia ruris]